MQGQRERISKVEIDVGAVAPQTRTTGKVAGYILSDNSFVTADIMLKYLVKGYTFESFVAETKQLAGEFSEDLLNNNGLIEPPYSLDALALTLKANTYHYRCVKQKANDVAGLGYVLSEPDPDTLITTVPAMEHKSNRKLLLYFLKNCNSRMTFKEILDCIWVDYESLGNGYLEVGRFNGKPNFLGHLRGTQMRLHKDGLRYAQVVGTQVRWFKLFGIPEDVDMETGLLGNIPENRRGNEVIHFASYNPTSKYYGIPDHIPAVSAITGAMAAAEFNLEFFTNNAVPQMAVIIEGGEVDPETQGVIESYFKEGIQARAHKTLILSVAADAMGQVPQIRFEKLAMEIRDASFRMYRQDLRDEVLTAHGVPPYRVGLAVTGTLGGSVSREATEVYKTSIVEPRQEILENRLNKLLFCTGFNISDWEIRFKDIDVRDKYMESRIIRNLMGYAGIPVITMNDARDMVGLGPYKGGDEILVNKNLGTLEDALDPEINIRTGDVNAPGTAGSDRTPGPTGTVSPTTKKVTPRKEPSEEPGNAVKAFITDDEGNVHTIGGNIDES